MRELLDEEDADTGGCNLLQGGHEALDHDGCKTQRELVDDEDLWSRHERLGEHEHLLLAAREGAPESASTVLESRKQTLRVCDPGSCVLSRERVGRHPQVVLDREVVKHAPALGDDCDS